MLSNLIIRLIIRTPSQVSKLTTKLFKIFILKKDGELMRKKIGHFLLDLDDWFAGKGIYFNLFGKNEDEHVSILAVWGFNLLFK